MDWKDEVAQATKRIQGHVRRTPLEDSLILSEMGSNNVFIKLESEQVTGSFKVRGAFNKVVKLQEQGLLHKDQGPVCASTGNHALASNTAFQRLGVQGLTFVPTTISPVKEAALRRLGADINKHGVDCMDGELQARKISQAEGRPYISPYNDMDVVIGQGTIGAEIFEDLPQVDVVYVPVGGGGLIAGIAGLLKAVKPSVKIIGCQPVESKVMYESIQAGKIIFEDSGDTLSDGTSGGIEDGSCTFKLCQELVDEWVLVSEEEISKAIFFMVQHHHKIVEGATGVSMGAFLKNPSKFKGKNVVIIACGSNISVEKLHDILTKELQRS